jgi:endonuclease YncB( thermonuclease family)
MNSLKTLVQQWSGVFFGLLLLFVDIDTTAAAACSASEPLEWAVLEKIVDGDTLHLTDGRKVRIIAINTPEMGRSWGASKSNAQPFAEQARSAVVTFFDDSAEVGLEVGAQAFDHYGRQLAHVYRANGDSLSAYLLVSGLAWQVVVPPNDSHWLCLEKLEKFAQDGALGVWSGSAYPAKRAERLTIKDTGFQRVRGKVSAVTRGQGGWWLQMGQLAIRLSDKDLHYFPSSDPMMWKNKRLTVRGWVIDRSQSKAVKKRGYSPLKMNLRHPAMMK